MGCWLAPRLERSVSRRGVGWLRLAANMFVEMNCWGPLLRHEPPLDPQRLGPGLAWSVKLWGGHPATLKLPYNHSEWGPQGAPQQVDVCNKQSSRAGPLATCLHICHMVLFLLVAAQSKVLKATTHVEQIMLRGHHPVCTRAICGRSVLDRPVHTGFHMSMYVN